MRYYLNIIFIFIYLLSVQSKDFNSNIFTQKLLSTTNRLEYIRNSHSSRQSQSDSRIFYKRFSSNTQTTTSTTPYIHYGNFKHISIPSVKYPNLVLSSQQQTTTKNCYGGKLSRRACTTSAGSWCCADDCGDTYGECKTSLFEMIFIPFQIILCLCGICCWSRLH
ncbi:unnamed protein product [Adineta steineri]|uniref:Uncharacterized protein n=1 Tax=Adineta steineri TaxID=433720 RepID=A0A813P787_9BILA|nr:unnamed protein product [Adineta steineri]CAF1346427.1 unnamed protein product [Adineta steineri]